MKVAELRTAVIEKFMPHFAPNAWPIYLKGRRPIMDHSVLKRLGFSIDARRQWPDVVLYMPKKNRLYLIEVVTSHGPVSPKRYQELEGMLSKSRVGRVYVSAFPDLKEFSRHSRSIAWETEVNGERIPRSEEHTSELQS